MDLHLHTPGSIDYQEPGVTYLDILRQAELRGLDIVAFTDHNTMAGYRAMRDEVSKLEYLEQLGRMQADEKRNLAEYRRLLEKILVLPGFEFTATFGFHILGIFSPDVPVRQLEHILLSLNIPASALDEGSSIVGASTDVLTAYHMINEAGGISIAAHANSSHGVAMRGFDFGGQTKIAYTQDLNLHALEVTDLDRPGRKSTARFFDGTKPEYPRRMRIIQGSDAHRLVMDPRNPKNLGVGERVTEVQLPERTFDALRSVFLSTDFARTRPFRSAPEQEQYDHVQNARDEGANIVQAFHESMTYRGGRLYAIIADVCALANTNGGTLYVGVSNKPKEPPVGIRTGTESIDTLRTEIERKLTPPLDVDIDVLESGGKQVIRLQVPRGGDPPYAIDDNKIYVRDEGDTNLAVRDEIVQLVMRGMGTNPATAVSDTVTASPEKPAEAEAAPSDEQPSSSKIEAPRTGVEIIATEQRKGVRYHIMRDLRNGSVVKNVTRSSARRLWHYAISQKESSAVKPDQVEWQGEIGMWKRYKRGGTTRYDLIQRDDVNLRVYYGVTEDGMHGPWQAFVVEDDPEEAQPQPAGE
ncbi:RNA-binding domain-containing protein [Aggregatilinea lenta]|uniref:RNA-binding domain-containing protein n=1 Tax=Aggregatilinea lenta TaxID=913108 RepID=UPI0013C319B1|nr:RNA-binding domain-containing protein [Aggregatilinea lenta]